jgi:adenylate cyclase, class 2
MMAKDHVETEVKLYVPDLAAVARKLADQHAPISAPRVLERNIRYDNAAGDFDRTNTVLRLRQDSRARLTYKDGEKLIGEYGSSRFEAEVEVSDLETMDIILGKLGFYPVLIYEKYRTTYQLEGAEVTLDEMPYGQFVEIEGDQIAIKRCVEALGLDGARRMSASYTVLFSYVQHNLGLDFKDLTFENFKGISVPESAFDGA